MQPWRSFSLFLLFASASVFLYFGLKFGQQFYLYSSLTKKTEAKATQWEIEEEGSRYAIWALYEFRYQEKTLKSRGKVPAPLFLNEGAAEQELRALSKLPLTAYFDPIAPTRSALERPFPTSYGIRCIVSFLVLIYFLLFKKKLKSMFN